MSTTATQLAPLWFIDGLARIHVSGEETGGSYAVLENTVPQGDMPPLHVHHREDEWFYVLEGDFTFHVGDAELTLPTGGFAFGPKGVPHTFIAGADGGKALVGFQPFQFEGFLREVGEPAPERVLPPRLETPPDMTRLIPIGARNGIEILGPPGPPPGR